MDLRGKFTCDNCGYETGDAEVAKDYLFKKCPECGSFFMTALDVAITFILMMLNRVGIINQDFGNSADNSVRVTLTTNKRF